MPHDVRPGSADLCVGRGLLGGSGPACLLTRKFRVPWLPGGFGSDTSSFRSRPRHFPGASPKLSVRPCFSIGSHCSLVQERLSSLSVRPLNSFSVSLCDPAGGSSSEAQRCRCSCCSPALPPAVCMTLGRSLHPAGPQSPDAFNGMVPTGLWGRGEVSSSTRVPSSGGASVTCSTLRCPCPGACSLRNDSSELLLGE